MSSNSKEIAKLKKKYSKWLRNDCAHKDRSLIFGYLPVVLSVWILTRIISKTDYKRKRQSIIFFQLSNVAYADNSNRRCDRLLRISLKLLDRRLPKPYLSLLRSSVKYTIKGPESRRKCSDLILQATTQLPVNLFDATGWYQLSRGLFSLGYFRAAWFARENSLDLSIKESSKKVASLTEIKRSLEAHLERGEYEVVTNLIKSHLVKQNFSVFLDLLRKSFVKADVDQNSNHVDGEKLFDFLIREKNVALVGPGVSDGLQGFEIDSADTVFRVRFGGLAALRKENVGSRCEIAQFNDLSAIRDATRDSLDFEFIDSLKLIAVFRDEPPKVRDIDVVNLFLELPVYRSTATSGLVNLVAVIMNSPAKLKLYGFDFYSRLGQYDSELMSFYRSNGWKFGTSYSTVFADGFLSCSSIAKSFSAHDPVSNFCFAQNLYKAGLFDIEPFGKSILELTPYQYVERLEEMLGDW